MAAALLGGLWGSLLGGCALLQEPEPEAVVQAPEPPPATQRDARERALQLAWVGRTRGDLVRSFGSPHAVLEVPGYRAPAVLILVYRPSDAASGCIDAFVVRRDGPEEVGNYFCR